MAILGPFNPVQLAGLAKRAALIATRRLRPDHRTIGYGSVRFSPSNMVRPYLYVVVAPSRFAARAFDDDQVGRARAFAADAFPAVFSEIPSSADENMILFAVEADDGWRDRALYVHRSGLVELLWALEPAGEGEDAFLLTNYFPRKKSGRGE